MRYYVDVISETGRVASITVRCAEDAPVVAWARQVARRGHYAAVRVERRGSMLTRAVRR